MEYELRKSLVTINICFKAQSAQVNSFETASKQYIEREKISAQI